jgi:hypothetical protein
VRLPFTSFKSVMRTCVVLTLTPAMVGVTDAVPEMLDRLLV